MSIITFTLLYASKVLLFIVYAFLLSTISGLGIGLGVYTMKDWLDSWKQRREEKRLMEKHHKLISEVATSEI